jgi:nucleoside-diphosphate-sugar epimerase
VQRILVTGALGQIGTELVPALRARYGVDNFVASDLRMPHDGDGPFEHLDTTDERRVESVVRRYEIDTIYHLAALLSAVAEQKPQVAWQVNLGGLSKVLEVARAHRCAVFHPSSIGAFGPSTPAVHTPQVTIQRPTSMYGITKVAGELLCDYYAQRFGLDTRGLRLPGLVSYVAPPGGGTTDYVIEMYHQALRYGHYTCYLRADTSLDLMYMPDAVRAMIEVMEADPARLQHRNAFNVTAMSARPTDVASAIRAHLPSFVVDYDVDPVRQRIADSWPDSLDDSAARSEWGWQARYDLHTMTTDMLAQLRMRTSERR